MKLYRVLLGQLVISLAVSAIDVPNLPGMQGSGLQRRTTTRKPGSPKPEQRPWPSMSNSANNRGITKLDKSSSSSTSPPKSGSPQRSRSPIPAPSQAGSSPRSKRGRSGSPSASSGSWNGKGFTSSSSPSSWGSGRYHREVDHVFATAEAHGPATIRSRARQDGFRTYKDVKKGKKDQTQIDDPNKVQTAVYARRGGTGKVTGLHLLDVGETNKITVDARKSKKGGWLQFHWTNGDVSRELVPPGEKDMRRGGHKIQGFIHGPGKVKVTTKNDGWEDLTSSSSSD